MDFNHNRLMFILAFLMIGYFWDIVGYSGFLLPHHTSQVLYPNPLFYPIDVEYSGLLLLCYPSDILSNIFCILIERKAANMHTPAIIKGAGCVIVR